MGRLELEKRPLLLRHLVDYNINLASPNETKTELSVVQNIAEVHHIPCGFMMIRREALETMQKAFPSTKYTDDTSSLTPAEQPFAYALFDCDVMDGHYLSEDWLFCERWKKMGGKVHAHISLSARPTHALEVECVASATPPPMTVTGTRGQSLSGSAMPAWRPRFLFVYDCAGYLRCSR